MIRRGTFSTGRGTMTAAQVRTFAYRAARGAGLDTDTADAVAGKVLERVVLGGETLDRVVADEIQKHAAA